MILSDHDARHQGESGFGAVASLAVERLLMTIGEALVRIRSFEPDILEELTDATKIIGMRNVLVHGYDNLDRMVRVGRSDGFIQQLNLDAEDNIASRTDPNGSLVTNIMPAEVRPHSTRMRLMVFRAPIRGSSRLLGISNRT